MIEIFRYSNRTTDGQETLWALYAENCLDNFKYEPNEPLTRPDSVNCIQFPRLVIYGTRLADIFYQKLNWFHFSKDEIPFTNANITFTLLSEEPFPRPGKDEFYESPLLMDFVIAEKVYTVWNTPNKLLWMGHNSRMCWHEWQFQCGDLHLECVWTWTRDATDWRILAQIQYLNFSHMRHEASSLLRPVTNFVRLLYNQRFSAIFAILCSWKWHLPGVRQHALNAPWHFCELMSIAMWIEIAGFAVAFLSYEAYQLIWFESRKTGWNSARSEFSHWSFPMSGMSWPSVGSYMLSMITSTSLLHLYTS